MYRAVLFDMDDTLIKTWEAKWAHYKLVGKKYYSLEITDDLLAAHWGEPFPRLVKSIFGDSVDVDEAIENFLRHEEDFLKLKHDGVQEVLETLRGRDIILGVITAMLTHVAEEDMRREFSLDLFTLIQGADQTLAHKPDPLVFEPALRQLESQGITDKKQIVYVGDALSDFYAARDAGLDFIAVTTGFVDNQTFKQAGAAKVIESLKDLPPLVIKKGKHE